MPELLDFDHERVLQPGDVLMVERKMKDQAGKRWRWKFFMVVTTHDVIDDRVSGHIVGNEKLKGKEYSLYIDQERNTVHYLPVEEWPEGLHAFRMAMVLQGLISNIV